MTRRRWAIVIVTAETVSAVWFMPRAVRALSVRMMQPVDAPPS